MSGFVCNTSVVEYIDNGETVSFEQEAAGKIGRYLGMFAAIIVPFTAPAIFGFVASSGVLGAGLATAATTGTLSTFANVLGSAAVGALTNAGAAYASGARGKAVWQSAGVGAVQAGIGAARAPVVTNAASTAGATAPAGAAQSIVAGEGAVSSSGMLGTIQRTIGINDPNTLRRISAVLINAAVNGQDMGRLNGLVRQQRASLDALRNSDRNVYNQRISEAQKILADADRMDPEWYARTRMADVAGIEANQFRQAMRNIAVRQGGSLDAGQQNSYERGAALHAGRSKALAYNQGFVQATGAQNQMRAQGAGLLGPDTQGFEHWKADTELRAGQEQARREATHDTWGGVISTLLEHDHPQSTSPDLSAPQQPQNTNPFLNGFNNVFGGGNQ